MIRRSKVTAVAAAAAVSSSRFSAAAAATDGRVDNSVVSKAKKKTFVPPSSKKEYKHLTTRSTAACYFFLVAVAVAVVLLLSSQLDAYIREYQGPLDHGITSIMKPYYEMSCPSSSHLDNTELSFSSHENDGTITSWDCNVILGKQTNDDDDAIIHGKMPPSVSSFPRIFMIGARNEKEDTFQSWQSQLLLKDATITSPSDDMSHHDVDEVRLNVSSQPYLKRINTLEVSNQFATSGGALRVESRSSSLRQFTSANNTHLTTNEQHQKRFLCRGIKWEQRLFYVYQHIFSELLTTYPNDDGFVIVEDDATLLNQNALAEEVWVDCDPDIAHLPVFAVDKDYSLHAPTIIHQSIDLVNYSRIRS